MSLATILLAPFLMQSMAQSQGVVSVTNPPGRYNTYDQCDARLTHDDLGVRYRMLHSLDGSRSFYFYDVPLALEDQVMSTAKVAFVIEGDVLGTYRAEGRALKRIGAAPGTVRDVRGIRISIDSEYNPDAGRYGRWRSPKYFQDLAFSREMRLLNSNGQTIATIPFPKAHMIMQGNMQKCLEEAEKKKAK